MQTFDNYLFHPSMLGRLMTESRTKDSIGETCKKALMECYVREKYGRKKKLDNQYIRKGLAVEEDSITLYSRVQKKLYFKNEEQISNEYFIGTPDLYDGESIREAKTIVDIKSSWDIHTFFNVLIEPINKDYYYQGQAYMDLTGADTFKLVYCLVNTPETIINDVKRRLMWQMGALTELDPLYLDAAEQMEKEMRFDDIPLQERWIQYVIERNDKDIEKAHQKMIVCREFLNKMEESKMEVLA